MLYYSLIYPFVLNGIPIWGNAGNVDSTGVKPIYKIKKRPVRIIKDNNSFIRNSYVKEPAADYVAELRWSFPTKKEAQAKVLYEAAQCGHFIRSQGAWIEL